MPVYEYEPDGHDCLICEGRVEVLQAATEEPLRYCPTCGLEVRRIVSRAIFKVGGELPQMEKAGKKGFTTYRKAASGTWERVDGSEGPESFHRPTEEAAPAPKVLDLDE
jgi:putative FmdB family regulatory protein